MFIHVVVWVRISFLFKVKQYFIKFIYILFIQSSVNGYTVSCHILAIVSYAAMNIGEHISVPTSNYFRFTPRSAIGGSFGNSVWLFLETARLFSNVYTILYSNQKCTRIHSLLYHPGRYRVLSHCGFDLHFPDDGWCWTSFHVLIGHLYIFYREMFVHILCLFLN